MEIVPTITTTAIDTFDYLLSRFYAHCSSIQIDIQDGLFVPNKTFTAESALQFFQKLPSERLSKYKSVMYDFHLMVKDYGASLTAINTIRKLVKMRYIFVHQNFTKAHSILENEHLDFPTVCPTINPEDPPIQVTTFLGKPLMSFPAIQIMTIHPGPQGQSFISSQLERVKDLRIAGYRGKVVIDGSINTVSLQNIMSRSSMYHPDIACIGSYFSRAPDQEIGQRIEILKELVK